MITIFKPDETDFSHNGLGVLDKNIIDPVVSEDLNGIYQFTFRYPLFAPHGLEIEGQSVIRSPVPSEEDQLFRVYRPIKSMGYLEVNCYHIFYDLIDNFIEDTNIVGKNGQNALSQLLGATQYKHKFRVFSDIDTSANARIVRMNPVEALLDDGKENSFISRWGGEIKRNNFDIRINKSIGSNRGKEIRHRKDLIGYEADVDWTEVTTRIMPKGFDGLLLPEKYVDSPMINKYVYPKIKMIEYQDIKAATGEYADDEDAVPLEEAYRLLRKAAKAEYTNNHVDVPHANYKVDFVTLDQTEEYKDLQDLQKVAIGDTVTVIHKEDGIKVEAKVISYRYNPLAKKYLGIELGNFAESLTKTYSNVQSMSDKISEISEATTIIQATADGKNTIYRGDNEPGNPNINDLWYKPNGSETEMYQYVEESGQKFWKKIADTAELSSVKAEVSNVIAQADADRANAEQKFNQAVTDANNYTEQKAAEFDTQLGVVKKDVHDTTVKADDAVTKADKAIEDAGFAKTEASTAKGDAATALSTANTAKNNAATALTTAQASLSSSGDALENAAKALKAYDELEIGGRNLELNSAFNGTDNWWIYTYGDTMIANPENHSILVSNNGDVVAIRGTTVTGIKEGEKYTVAATFKSNHSGYIRFAVKATQNFSEKEQLVSPITDIKYDKEYRVSYTFEIPPDVDGFFVTYRVYNTTETFPTQLEIKEPIIVKGNTAPADWTPAPEDVQVQITDINGELARKVSQNTFDTLNGTVQSQSTTISQNQSDIAAKADKTTVDTINKTVAKHTTDIKANADGLKLKAEASAVNNLSGTVSNHTNQIAANAKEISARLTQAQVNSLVEGKNYVNQTSLDATAKGIKADITQVSSDLDSLDINDRNLQRNSAFYNLDGWSIFSGSSFGDKLYLEKISGENWLKVENSKGTNVAVRGSDIVDLAGEVEYTIATTFYANHTGTIQFILKTYDSNGDETTTTVASTSYSASTEVRLSRSFKTPKNTVRGYMTYRQNNSTGIYPTMLRLSKPKIQKGNKATDWTPAPEDMATLEKVVSLEANINGLQSTVANKAEQSQVTQLAGQVSSKVESKDYNSKMTQLDKAINLRVQKGDVVGQINVEAGQTLIQNNKILLDGNTYTIGTTFANDIKAKSLDAVKANISDLRTLMLTADTVTSTMIKTDTSLIDKLFATDANVTRLTAKAAFINAVKATDITADRVTGGTFNGSKMNIINLNADSITTGTMQGRNLSINLNTGEVLFQKGIIKRSDGKFNIDVTKGRLESYDAIGGMTLENGSLKLYKKPLLLEIQSREDMYGSIDYENSFFSGRGMTMTGNQGIMMKTMDYSANWVGRPTGSGLYMRNKRIKVESEDSIKLQAGEKVPRGGIFETPAEIMVGVNAADTSKAGSDIKVTATKIDISTDNVSTNFLFNRYGFFMKDSIDAAEYDYFGVKPYKGDPLRDSNFEFKFGGADRFRFGHDGSGDRLISTAVYHRTYGNAANMFITGYGTIGRSTSASKYKLNISEIPDIDNYAERVLALKPKQWFDKASVELYSRELRQGRALTPENLPITPFYGLIAEDVAGAGLEKYVQYGADGKEIEGIMYDRLWTLLIPIVKQQKEDITKLKNKISEMENAI